MTRLATYRVAGLTSAPFIISTLIGFSMLEMYVPDKFKFPCKCAKWTGSMVFYGVCHTVNNVAAGIETKIFGQPLPIDAPQLMGTLPKDICTTSLRTND